MSKSLHLICRRENAGLIGVKRIDPDENMWRSESWEISPDDANKIVGGWVYMHPAKNQPSEFGGVVVRVEHSGILDSHGRPEIAIIFQFQKEARSQKWRGETHTRAWCSGPVPKTLAHEQDSTAI